MNGDFFSGSLEGAGLRRSIISSTYNTLSFVSAAGSEVRIVLLGKTGVGKSASANTILGSEEFVEEASPESVTRQASRSESKVSGRKVVVVDTPGLFDTSLTNEQLKEEIVRCVYLTVPGPHVFLLVIRLGTRFTEEERMTMRWIQENFSKLALKYSLVLFTGEDAIDIPVEDYIEKSPALKQLVSECEGRYHAFENRKKERTQVTRLLAKIDRMVVANGGQHYTDQMRRIQEEAERKRREEEMKQQEEESKRQEVQRQREEAMRMEWERQESQRREEDRRRFEDESRQKAEEERKRREADKMEFERRREEDRARSDEQDRKRREEDRQSREEEKREWERRRGEEKREEERKREEDRKRHEEQDRKRREEEEKKRQEEKERESNNNPLAFLGKVVMTVPALVGGAAVGLVKAVVDVPVGMVKSAVEYGDDRDRRQRIKGSDLPEVLVGIAGAEIKGGVVEVAKAPLKVFSGATDMVTSLWKS